MLCACGILSSVTSPALQNVSASSHKRQDFFLVGGGELLNMKCVSIFSTTFIRNIFHSKKNRPRYDKKNVYRSSCKVPFIFVRF